MHYDSLRVYMNSSSFIIMLLHRHKTQPAHLRGCLGEGLLIPKHLVK